VKNQKSAERDQLILEFGILIQPLVDLARQDQPPDATDYRVAIAKVQAGEDEWRKTVSQFTTFSPDLSFNQERNEISHVPETLVARVRAIIDELGLGKNPVTLQSTLKDLLDQAREDLFEFIRRVPVNWEPELFQANTPFTSYLRIKESLAVVSHRLHYFDRYLKHEFFNLFLRGVGRSVSVRLVTTESSTKAIVAVSGLCCREFTDYRLIRVDPKVLHDRNLRVDDQVFSLGPGIDRAGIALTNFGPSDSSDAAHNTFDAIIDGGVVVHQS
jgi:hypothetical protein